VDRKYLFFLVLAAAITVLSFGFKFNTHYILPDEDYYLNYATYINKYGIEGFSYLFQQYSQDRAYSAYPNPFRIGYILFSASWLRIFGYSFLSLAYFSFFCYCLFLIVSFYFIRKYFSEDFALLAVILLAFSPLAMAMARRAISESAYCLLSTLSLWLFLDYVREDSNPKRIAFFFTYSFTILIKETAVLLCPFFFLFLVFRKFIQKKQIKIKDFLYSAIFPLATVFALYVILGGIDNTIRIIGIIINSPKTSIYAITYGGGPWYRYLIDYLVLSPATTILGTGFIFHYLCLHKKERREEVDYFILFFIYILLVFNLFTKNVRYVINLDMPLRIFSLFVLTQISRQISKNNYRLLLAGLVIAIALGDLINFNYLFLTHEINDPVSFALLKAKHIIY